MSPPYDVISPEEQEELHALSEHNAVRLILGKRKTGDSDWDNRYTRSARTLDRWTAEGVLVQSEAPAMYLTSQSYRQANGVKTRWGLISLVRIEDEDSGVILPHEKTFSAHREDRLHLMRATGAQFSQIFALYEDPGNQALRCLGRIPKDPPQVSFTFRDGTEHAMWAVKDRDLLAGAAEAMAGRSLLIADGHHRFETSRKYRNMMRARYGMRPGDRSFEFVMMYLSNMNDPGLTVLPAHRLIRSARGVSPGELLGRLSRWFQVTPLPWTLDGAPGKSAELRAVLAEAGRGSIAFGAYFHGEPTGRLLELEPGAGEDVGDDLHPALKGLDVMVLSRLVLQRGLGFRREDLDNDKQFLYESDMVKGLRRVRAGASDILFLLNPTKTEQVKEVAANRLIMPRKSTYFYPKVITGLVFNRMDPHERIEKP